MVWTEFCLNGQEFLTFLDGRQTAQACVQTLEDNLLPFAKLLAGLQWIFQQYNAQMHKVQIKNLDWSSCRLDLNPVENLGHHDKIIGNSPHETIENVVYGINPEIMKNSIFYNGHSLI